MKIRAARDADIQALLAIGREFYALNPFRDSCELDTPSLHATLLTLMHDHVLLVLTDDDKVVGTCGAWIAPVYWNKSRLMAEEFFWWVSESHRGGKAGRKLRECLLAALKLRGVDYVIMAALADSPAFVGATYEKHGFRKVETKYMKEI